MKKNITLFSALMMDFSACNANESFDTWKDLINKKDLTELAAHFSTSSNELQWPVLPSSQSLREDNQPETLKFVPLAKEILALAYEKMSDLETAPIGELKSYTGNIYNISLNLSRIGTSLQFSGRCRTQVSFN